MLYWILVFVVLAIVAAALGFGGLAGSFAWAAQLLFWVFLGLLLVAFIAQAFRGRPPVP